MERTGENAYQLLEDLRNELQVVIDLLNQNKLSTNVTKCEFMFLGNSKQLCKISEIGDLKVGEDEIKRVRNTKYFGLTIDETLSWNQQYKIVKGILKGVLIPSENFDSSPSITAFSSILGIGGRSPQIWGHVSANKLHNLQKLQDRAMT